MVASSKHLILVCTILGVARFAGALEVGVFGSLFWPQMGQSMALSILAARHFNERDGSIVPAFADLGDCNIKMNVTAVDYMPVDCDGATEAFLRGVQETGYAWKAIVGAGNSLCTVPITVVSSHFGAAQVGYASTSPNFDSKSLFPHYARTIASDASTSEAIASYVHSMGWRRIGVLADRTAYGTVYAQELTLAAGRYGIEAISQLYSPTIPDTIDQAVFAMKNGDVKPRIIVSVMMDDAFDLLAGAMVRHGLVGDGYHLIFTDFFNPELQLATPDLLRYFDGAVQVQPVGGRPGDPKWTQLLGELAASSWQDLGPHVDVGQTLDRMGPLPLAEAVLGWSLSGPIHTLAGNAFDAVASVGLAACSLGTDAPSPAAFFEEVARTAFDGVTGRVELSSLGTRTTDTSQYILKNIRVHPSGVIDIVAPVALFTDRAWSFSDAVRFSGGSTAPPRDGTATLCVAGEELSGVECVPCRAGFVSGEDGTEECRACPPGTYSSERIQCLDCDSGSFASAAASTECKACPAHAAYLEKSGNPEIPFFTRTAADNRTDCKCTEGYYGEPGDECHECPVGGLCEGTGFSDVIRPVPLPGWFMRASTPDVMIKCRNDIACPGGDAGICGPGFVGDVCSACAEGWYLSQGRECRECSDGNRAAAGLAIAIFLALTSLIYLSANVDRTSGKLRATIAVGAVANAIILQLQIVSLLINLRANWPPQLRALMSSIRFVNVDVGVLSPECIFPLDFAAGWRLQATLPYYFAAAYLSWAALVRWPLIMLVEARDEPFAARLSLCRNAVYRSLNATFQIWSLLHVNASTTILQAFACVEQPDGSFTMPVYAAFDCASEEYRREIMPVAWFALLTIAVGYPVSLAALLFSGCDKMGEGARTATSGISQPYKRKFYFWCVSVAKAAPLLPFAFRHGGLYSIAHI